MTSAARIVSLLPSATEIVCALGLEDALVGRSHECDWPPSVRRLPVCTSASVDSSQSSAAIDEQVRSLLEKTLSLYSVDTGELAALRPDLIVTQAQCEVCAVSLCDVERAVADSLGSEVRIVSLDGADFGGVLDDIVRVGDATGAGERSRQFVLRLRSRMADIRRRGAARARRGRVAAIEWTQPLMMAGNWVPELIETAGGESVLASAGRHSPWATWNELAAADPDVIVAMPCGFGIERTRAELAVVAQSRQWQELRAVSEGAVFVTDANHFFSRPGPRLVESCEIVAEVLDEVSGVATVDVRHCGTGWQRF
ncbi:MAG TPA: cobalamin-binding protein [Candidatus Binatia bacterium]|nr:cobalamin-binding protein [Candidatus Binatia bacterium]